MTLRYECDAEGFEGNYIEFSERWTRGEMRRVWEMTGEEYWAFIRSKMVSVHLETDSGGVLNTVESLTTESLDELNYNLFRWVDASIVKLVLDLQKLGEAFGRRLFDPSEGMGQNPTP